ncbi:MAG: radical SAM protein [bacterium]
MRILLVNPPNSGRNIIGEKYGAEIIRQVFRQEPLSLELLAGMVSSETVDIFDMKADTATPYEKKLSDFQPDLVGVTCMTCEAKTALRIMEITKEYHPHITTVVGGVHASNDPEFFNHPFVDYLVVGLGKKTFSDLVQGIKEKKDVRQIPGVGSFSNGKFQLLARKFQYEDLADDIPPNKNLVKKYRPFYRLGNMKINVGAVDTSYGCTNKCNFCCLWKTTQGKYLARKSETIVRDIELSKDDYFIRLVDANTFGDKRRAEEIASLVAQKEINKVFIVDARADTIVSHPELIRLWSRIGLRAVVIGLEEISDRHLTDFNKRTSLTMNTEAIRILHDNGVMIIGDFIVSPDYDEKDFDNLKNYVKQNKIESPGFSVLTPMPGTALYEQMKDQIIIKDLDYYTLTNAVLPTAMPEEKFYERVGDLYREFHAHSLPKQLLSQLFLRESFIKAGELLKRKFSKSD